MRGGKGVYNVLTFQKSRGGKGVYNVLTFQKSRGGQELA